MDIDKSLFLDPLAQRYAANDFYRVVTIVGPGAEVTWSREVPGQINVLLPADASDERVDAVSRDIAALQPPIYCVGVSRAGANALAGLDAPPDSFLTDEQLNVIEGRIASSARIKSRNGGLHRSQAHIDAAADRERLFLAVVDTRKRIREQAEHHEREMTALRSQVESLTARADIMRLSLTQAIEGQRGPAPFTAEKAGDPFPCAVSIILRVPGLEQQNRQLHQAIARLKTKKAQGMPPGPVSTANQAEPASSNAETEVQKRVDELLLGPRPAVFDCDGRRLREVLRSWLAPRSATAAPSLLDDNQKHMARLAEMSRKP